MRIPLPLLDGIVDGRFTLAFRRWDRPRAKVGAAHRTAVGLVAIEAVDEVTVDEITEDDARAAGAAGRDELVAFLGKGTGQVYRVRVRYAGADPRVGLRNDAALDDEQVAYITQRLARYDRASRHGPWTSAVLQLISDNPGRRAPALAAELGRETQPFKTDVRKLKDLGLTESLEVGYRISPRGRAYLDRT